MKRFGILVAGMLLIAVTAYAWRGPLSMALMSRAIGNLMDPGPDGAVRGRDPCPALRRRQPVAGSAALGTVHRDLRRRSALHRRRRQRCAEPDARHPAAVRRRGVPDALPLRSHRRARADDDLALGRCGRGAQRAAPGLRPDRCRAGRRRIQRGLRARLRLSHRPPRRGHPGAVRCRTHGATLPEALAGRRHHDPRRGRRAGPHVRRRASADRPGGRVPLRLRRSVGRDLGRHREVRRDRAHVAGRRPPRPRSARPPTSSTS